MGVVDGSIHWNGQNNFFDFIQFSAEKAGMTREEYIATYGFPHKTESVEIEENKKKPGPDPYHRGLDDEEVDDKEAQIKKQAKMDDDDPDAYKEMPGDKEAREKGEVKTSKATKAYSKLYGEDLDEGVMGDLHQMANEIGDEDKFVKAFFKEYGDKVKKSKDSEEWVRSLYKDTIQESLNEISNKNAEKYSQPLRKLKNPKKIRNIAAGRGKYDDMLVWLSHNAKNLDYHLDGQGQLHVNGEDYEMVRTELGESIVSEGQVLLFDELNDDFEALSTKISNLADRAVDPNWKKALDKMYKQLDRLIDIAANQDNRLGAIDTNESVSEVNHTGSEASDKMAFSQLERIIDYATMIRDRMAAGKGLDAWMYGKVIKAEDYLNTLYDVIDGDDGVVETQKMNKKDWKKIKPFNKHITKDGEKFVMSYDDRIGTFLEPVEIVDEAKGFAFPNSFEVKKTISYVSWGVDSDKLFKGTYVKDRILSDQAKGEAVYINKKAKAEITLDQDDFTNFERLGNIVESVNEARLDNKLKKELDSEYKDDSELSKHPEKKDAFFKLLMKYAPTKKYGLLKKEVAKLFGFDNLEPGSNDGEMLEYFYMIVIDHLGLNAYESVDEKKVWTLLNPEKGYVRKIAVNDYTKRPEQAAKWKDIKSATKAGKEFTKYHGVDVVVQAIDESVNENLEFISYKDFLDNVKRYKKGDIIQPMLISSFNRLRSSDQKKAQKILNKALDESVNEEFPGKGEIVKAKDLDYDMLDYFDRMNIKLLINTKSKKNIKGSVGKMFNDLVFNGDDIDKKDIVSVKILETSESVNEADDEEQKSTDRGPLDDDKIETALKKKAKDTGVPIGIIRAVMRRGLAAWKSGHRPGANQQQWGYARVNAFLTKGEGTWGKADKDLAKEVRDGGHDKKLKKA